MKRYVLTFIGIFFLFCFAFSQDTIYLDKKVEYSSDTISIDRIKKNYCYHYAREIIKVSQDSFKIEICNYLDNKRLESHFVNGYKILDDSILIFRNERWIFRKAKDRKITVTKIDSCYTIKGKVSSIIPFIKHGEFVYLNSNNDTLLTEIYKQGYLTHFQTKKTIINDSIYYIVDEYPKFPKQYGELIEYIFKRIKYPIELTESAIMGKTIVSTVISKTGELKNIEVIRGIDLLLDVEAVRVIMTLPKFEPGKIKGEVVNTNFIIPVKFSL